MKTKLIVGALVIFCAAVGLFIGNGGWRHFVSEKRAWKAVQESGAYEAYVEAAKTYFGSFEPVKSTKIKVAVDDWKSQAGSGHTTQTFLTRGVYFDLRQTDDGWSLVRLKTNQGREIMPRLQPPPTTQPQLTPGAVSIDRVLREFTGYSAMTPEPAQVSLGSTFICRPLNFDQTPVLVEPPLSPHEFGAIEVYMNLIASKTYNSGDGPYPEGSVIVKSKAAADFRSAGELVIEDGKLVRTKSGLQTSAAGIGGMIKRHPGYAPQSGDWEYFYTEGEKAIEHGLISSCVKCHDGAGHRDYVFGDWGEPTLGKGY